MADITYSLKATERRASPGITPGKGDANTLKVLCTATVEVPASASGTTIKFGRIPSNARLSSLSKIEWDDLTTTGAPTLDLGLASVDSNVTSDPDALSNGHDVTGTGASALVAVARAEWGKPAWDFVSGLTADPGGELDVYGSIVDAATAGLTGTVSVEIYGYLD